MGALTIGRELDVAVVTFDLPDEPVNKFTDAVIEEFDATFERLGTDTSVSAIVVLSGKRDIFIAGADIDGFVSLESSQEALGRVRSGALPRPLGIAPASRTIHPARLGRPPVSSLGSPSRARSIQLTIPPLAMERCSKWSFTLHLETAGADAS